MTLVPIALMLSRICFCEPAPSATTDTTEAMPMMMPSIVRNVRRRCAFIASSAMRSASRERSRRARHDSRAGTRAIGAAAGASSRRRSATMRPSLISITREACSATCMSCVTRTIVWPSACSACSRRSISSPLRLSSAPVGSSARITSPPFISARAIDTRCCWPPESWPGLWSRRSDRPSRPSRSAARARRAAGSLPA